MIGLSERYYCRNVRGCAHARADRIYGQAEYDAGQGSCRGDGGDGCGQPLQRGAPHDRRALLATGAAASLAAAGGVGWLLKQKLFPDPLTQIGFASTETRTEDAARQLPIEVLRGGDTRQRAVVELRFADGSAKAGDDFETSRAPLVFEPGETRKSLALTLLPDASQAKGERHFTVTLANVEGTPRHVVFIVPRKVDPSQQLQAEQVVRGASRVAVDIAGYVVRHDVANRLMAANRSDAAAFRRYQEAMIVVQGNLARARERYAETFRDMQQMQPQLVLQAMSRLGDELKRQGFDQQSSATLIMKRHYEEYLARRSIDMDRWSIELSQAVPRVAQPGSPST